MTCRVIDKRREKAKKTVVTATVKSQSFLTNEFKGTVTYKKNKNTLTPRLFPHNTTNVTSNNDFRQPKSDQKNKNKKISYETVTQRNIFNFEICPRKYRKITAQLMSE